MIEYIYIVKCPGCEDEMFNFFTDARMQCDLLMSKKPIITQVEVERNDFGECTDHHDLGTVWSWEEAMKDTEGGYTEAEPTKSIFTKDDLKLMADGKDPEFDNLDNSVDCEVEEPKLTEASPADATRAPKDSDYVIVLKNPITNRHTFFGNNYRMTTDLNKAMTYPGKFSAQDDIKYAADQSVQATNDPNDFYYEDNFFVTTVAEAKKLQGKYEDRLQHKARLDKRKPIPEGMTIEQLVEEMEENEDTVECTWCEDLFDKSECRYEVDLGWLCSRCEMAIKSRGETLTFRENNYWDFLDEDLEDTRTLADLVKDSISHLTNDLSKDPWAEDFADDVIKDIENNYDSYVPEDMEHYNHWCGAVASEVSRQLNNQPQLDEELETKTWICVFEGNEIGTVEAATEEEAGEKMQRKYPEYPYGLYDGCFEVYPADEEELTEATELHDLGNEYDGGYPAETPEVSDSHLKLCPECGKETFDIETGICVECGFN